MLMTVIALVWATACSSDPQPNEYRDPDWSRLTAKEVCARFTPLIDEEWLGRPVVGVLANDRDDTCWPKCSVSSDDLTSDYPTPDEGQPDSRVTFYFVGATELEFRDVDDLSVWFGDATPSGLTSDGATGA